MVTQASFHFVIDISKSCVMKTVGWGQLIHFFCCQTTSIKYVSVKYENGLRNMFQKPQLYDG